MKKPEIIQRDLTAEDADCIDLIMHTYDIEEDEALKRFFAGDYGESDIIYCDKDLEADLALNG